MQRFNSDPDQQGYGRSSTILAGNLRSIDRGVVQSLSTTSDNEDFSDNDFVDSEKKPVVDEQLFNTATEDEVKRADRILFDVFGLNLISVVIKLLLSGRLLPGEFVCQGLAYKCQSVVRGASGVRYLKSWGIFWAACRNILKTRGLICFRDHFCIPSLSNLVKFKKDALMMCGLKESTLGKSGLQSRSVEMWTNSKLSENIGSTIAVSVCMDGKKISVTKEGTEDMGGIGSLGSRQGNEESYLQEVRAVEELLKKNDRPGLFRLYDKLSSLVNEINCKVAGIKVLEKANEKRLPSNPALNKYIHVLKTQAEDGNNLIKKVSDAQSKVIQMIAEKRNSSHLLPKASLVNIQDLDNLTRLEVLPEDIDKTILLKIEQEVKTQSLLDVPWESLCLKLGDVSSISRESESAERLLHLCYMTTDQIFSACGLGSSRPLADMKSIYVQSHTYPAPLSGPRIIDSNIIGSLCATMAPMTFGNNCQIKESGFYIKNGICSDPGHVVITGGNTLDFTSLICEGGNDVFKVELMTIAQAILDAYICESRKGCLVLQCSAETMVAINIPTNAKLAKEMISLCNSYIRKDQCIAKRSKEMIRKQDEIRASLNLMEGKIKVLGCYPLHDKFHKTLETSHERIITDLKALLPELMQGKKQFLSKQARELIAVNVSDMSGNPSNSPHTTLAATFLSSVSLKTIGETCITEVIQMVESNEKCICLNIGVDGESLHLATNLPNGAPGTELTLLKCIKKKLQEFNKESLVKIVSENVEIPLDFMPIQDEEWEENEEPFLNNENLENLEESIVAIQQRPLDDTFSLDDLEDFMRCDNSVVNRSREAEVKKFTVTKLRNDYQYKRIFFFFKP